MHRRAARVVIGANFGDEGKGLITDYFVSQVPSVTTVVRFNSGAQAGHTVITPQGQRHVFGHIGSGAQAGGAGPMRHEGAGPPYPGIVDHTNIPNRYQGALRFGLLDLDILAGSIAADLGDAASAPVAATASLAVTCLDQLGDAPARFIHHGVEQRTTREALLERLTAATHMATLYIAAGPLSFDAGR